MPRNTHKKNKKPSNFPTESPADPTEDAPENVDDIVRRVKTFSMSPTRDVYPSTNNSRANSSLDSEDDRVESRDTRASRCPPPETGRWEEIFEFSSDEELSTPSDEDENGDGTGPHKKRPRRGIFGKKQKKDKKKNEGTQPSDTSKESTSEAETSTSSTTVVSQNAAGPDIPDIGEDNTASDAEAREARVTTMLSAWDRFLRAPERDRHRREGRY